MIHIVGNLRGYGGQSLLLIAIAAACSGHVEERIDTDVPGGTGGTAANPVGGVGGTRFGGSSGGGVGGTLGAYGSYGQGGAYGYFGTGGYFGDAGSPSFGGTSSGGSGGTLCTPAPWRGEACWSTQGCIDPYAPTPERIELNQPVAFDAGTPDSGSWDSGIGDAVARTSIDAPSSPIDAGPSDGPGSQPPDGGTVITIAADVCRGPTGTPSATYLAFDLWSEYGAYDVDIYTSNQQCSGSALGHALFNPSPPVLRRWTTQCVHLPNKSIDRIVVVSKAPGTTVANLRFVSDCKCPRQLVVPTSCGWEGTDGGLVCRP